MITSNWKRWRQLILVVVLALLPAGSAGAQDTMSVLEEILQILRRSGQITEEQRKALLERAKREAEQAKATREKIERERAAPVMAGIDRERLKPFLSSPDGDFRVELGGQIQLDYHAAEEGARTLTGSDLTDRFLTRRIRLDLTGRAFRWIEFKLESDFTEGVSLKDAYLNFRFLPEIALQGGQFKVPFSLEELTSSRFIDFVERSVLNEIAPARDVGAMVQGNLFGGVVGYALGVFNGSGEDNADNNDGKDIAGRVTLAPFRPTDNYWLKGLQLGGNFTWGDQNTVNSAQGRTSARTGNRFTYFGAHPTRGDRLRFGGDLAWLVGPAALKVEYGEQRNERKKMGLGGADLDGISARGWYVSGTYVLTGEDKPFNGPVIPQRPFAPIAGRMGPGAWELGLRYADLAFESDDPLDFFDGNIANGITGGGSTAENGVEAVTAGVNWYLNSRVRAMLNWTRYWYDNTLGTPFSCRLSECSAATLQRGDDASWEVLSRIQLWF
jgi:phosphate-selective porin OprO and OprP